MRRRFQKKYCHNIMYHTTLSDIVKAILQNGGHFLSNTSISETKMLTLCIGFVGRRFHKKYCRIHHAIVSAILEAILQKMATIFNVMRVIFETMRQRNVTVVSTHISCGQWNSDRALLRASHNTRLHSSAAILNILIW